jgi:hypothetical protein
MQRLRKRIHVSPATAIATLALVFAMTGGAYAAKHYLITSTKQISPKVLKSLKGANGKNGVAGANGAQGAQGPAGANGKDGANGTNGTNGKDGTSGKDGVSVTGVAASAGECPAGGVKYTSASGNSAVCNGKDGTTGFTETLPTGKTEKGDWSLALTATAKEQLALDPISFAIPLASELAEAKVHYIKESGIVPTGCTGSVENPGATKGNLCIFTREEENLEPFGGSIAVLNPEPTGFGNGFNTAGKAGTSVSLWSKAAGSAKATGDWAVTAP